MRIRSPSPRTRSDGIGNVQSRFFTIFSVLQHATGLCSDNSYCHSEKYDINGKVPTSFISVISSRPFRILNTRLTPRTQVGLPLDSGSHELDSIRSGSPGFKFIALAISSAGGNGYLYEIYPDGHLVKNYYYFYQATI